MQDAGAAAVGARERGQEQAAGFFQVVDDGLGIGGFDAGDFDGAAAIEFAGTAPAGIGGGVVLPGPEDVGRGEGGAVMEFDALAQLEGVGLAVGADVDGFGQQGTCLLYTSPSPRDS